MADVDGGDALQRDAVLEKSGTFFGRSQDKITVQAGSVALIHFDILHRAARRALPTELDIFKIDTPWRPMIK